MVPRTSLTRYYENETALMCFARKDIFALMMVYTFWGEGQTLVKLWIFGTFQCVGIISHTANENTKYGLAINLPSWINKLLYHYEFEATDIIFIIFSMK